jgi:hypothetical protein
LPGGGIKGGRRTRRKGRDRRSWLGIGDKVRAKSSAHAQKKKQIKENDELFLKKKRCLVARYEYLVGRVL